MSDYNETNLRGLTYEAAAAVALEYATALKKAEQALAAAREEESLWKRRAALALEKGMTDLVAPAEAKAAESAAKVGALDAERAELAAKVARMKEQLPLLKMGSRSVDADLLLSELTIAAGGIPGEEEKSSAALKLDRELGNAGADAALEELKRKMSGGS
ncbi:MAG: chromosome partitioning protein [Spirochaetia bacterium]|nr:chromosome partitioning protein [Spirochaetia bacterium]